MEPIQKTARIAGILYLGNIITGVFAQAVRSQLIVPGNAEATASNIIASTGLYRFGIVSDLMMVLLYLMMGLFFYELLKAVSKRVALMMLLLNLAGVSILAFNMLNLIAPLIVLSGTDFLKSFSTVQLQDLVLFFTKLHEAGYNIAIISYGFYLLPLGYLVFKSGYLPRILGILLMLAFSGWLTKFTVQFLFPGSSAFLSPIALSLAMIGEFSFCLWLLIKGVKTVPLKTAESH